MTATTIAYFGYGSLVNLGSLRTPYISAHRATLSGWKRGWLSRPGADNPPREAVADDTGLAFLSAVAAPGASIDGLIIIDHASSLPALDEREAMYSRVSLAASDLFYHDSKPECEEQFLYVANAPAAHAESRILRSYLDVVMQGYLQHFGEDGLQRFFDSTLNFDIPVREDRDTPLYPRATVLSDTEVALFSRYCQDAAQ